MPNARTLQKIKDQVSPPLLWQHSRSVSVTKASPDLKKAGCKKTRKLK